MAVVVAAVSLDLLGVGIVVPILPFYVRSLGVSDVFVGPAAAAYSFAGFLAAPTVGLTTLVSTAGPERARGRAFGVTRGAASLGRTVGPPLAAAGYVVAVPLPFLAGALVFVPVVVLLGARW